MRSGEGLGGNSGLRCLIGIPLALAALASPARAQSQPRVIAAATPVPAAASPAVRPFVVGERLIYSVKIGLLGSGTAIADLHNVDTVRGTPVYHTVFTVAGSLLFFHVNDQYESWFDPTSLVSLRYHQKIDQSTYTRNRTYEIFPDRGVYIETGKTQLPTVEQPLDDGAFLYFLRTIPLIVGRTYTFNRYFKPDRNPVTVTVVRREHIRIPAGEFDAVVLRPKIKAKGIFAENANAEVWLSDDSARLMLMMHTHLPFGSVTFQLRERQLPTPRIAEK
jgi:Protein of unknown function (DUF3108)